VPGYEASGWSGVLVPAGTPQVIIEKINRGISDVLKNPDIQRRLSAQGAAAAGDTPEGFSRLVRNELTKWSQVIRATGVKGD